MKPRSNLLFLAALAASACEGAEPSERYDEGSGEKGQTASRGEYVATLCADGGWRRGKGCSDSQSAPNRSPSDTATTADGSADGFSPTPAEINEIINAAASSPAAKQDAAYDGKQPVALYFEPAAVSSHAEPRSVADLEQAVLDDVAGANGQSGFPLSADFPEGEQDGGSCPPFTAVVDGKDICGFSADVRYLNSCGEQVNKLDGDLQEDEFSVLYEPDTGLCKLTLPALPANEGTKTSPTGVLDLSLRMWSTYNDDGNFVVSTTGCTSSCGRSDRFTLALGSSNAPAFVEGPTTKTQARSYVYSCVDQSDGNDPTRTPPAGACSQPPPATPATPATPTAAKKCGVCPSTETGSAGSSCDANFTPVMKETPGNNECFYDTSKVFVGTAKCETAASCGHSTTDPFVPFPDGI